MEKPSTMAQHALVVEGGAMRGIFSAGVLDRFIDHQFSPFDFCIGVSAGSTSLASWLANQKQRTYKVVTDYSCRPEFINFKRFLRGGHWLDLDWLWDITTYEIPIDTDKLHQQSVPLYVVTTDINTGLPHYISSTPDNVVELLKASCSVPVAYRNYPVINGMQMTDGGVADSIPVEKAYQLGAKEITVILSRPLGYEKKPSRIPWLTKKFLAQHPQLANAALLRAESYNRSIAFIKQPPSDCKINVIAPPADFPVGRLTTDLQKLDIGYQMGIDAAEQIVMAK
ncbi:patatin-like phospholipase family protein [Vibrio rumoiensis]|uniref:Patatin family protein n=1 Tax=Vibrio rumoiensis 1S-45 TaxID=1188252 RepID=A0A1E5DZV4_9VIBR|nr:patatin family protein [Vibrio rumoiensis]OEF23524.1 patatin family protein [Vibrio rumoiensis 1S-45]